MSKKVLVSTKVLVSVSVSENIGIGFGIEKIGIGKSFGFCFVQIFVTHCSRGGQKQTKNHQHLGCQIIMKAVDFKC